MLSQLILSRIETRSYRQLAADITAATGVNICAQSLWLWARNYRKPTLIKAAALGKFFGADPANFIR